MSDLQIKVIFFQLWQQIKDGATTTYSHNSAHYKIKGDSSKSCMQMKQGDNGEVEPVDCDKEAYAVCGGECD